MKEMGFQACCLRCDAVDVAASSRCKRCIARHTTIRDKIANTSYDDPLTQFAKEMLMMAAAPHQYDHDEIHGQVLHEQQELASALSEPIPESTVEEVQALFNRQRAKKKRNIIQDVANQNEWKNEAPTKKLQQEMIGLFDEENHSEYGQRTIPSKKIKQVDRSDRSGEDRVLADRLEAEKNANRGDLREKVVVQKRIFNELQRKREDWKDVVDEVTELLDE